VGGDPGHDLAVVEAHDEVHAHVHAAAHALDGAHEVGMVVAHRHAVGDAHRPRRRVELGLEHEGVGAVPAPGGHDVLGAARDLVLLIALCRFLPGQAIGTRANPGSSNALYNYKLAMPAAAAAVIILAWAGIAAAAGAWRTRTRDA